MLKLQVTDPCTFFRVIASVRPTPGAWRAGAVRGRAHGFNMEPSLRGGEGDLQAVRVTREEGIGDRGQVRGLRATPIQRLRG